MMFISGIGGIAGSAYGVGTVFAVNPTNGAETVLHAFIGGDGAIPYAGLLKVGGALYGTAYEGGHGNHGAVFVYTP